MRLELITIGDELLLGYTVDTNAAFIARTLAEIGVEVVRRSTVGDDAPAIADAAILRRLPAAALVEAAEKTPVPAIGDNSYIWLQSVNDGWVLREPPSATLARSTLLFEWVDMVVILTLTAILVGMITANLQESLSLAQRHESSLEKVNTELKRHAGRLFKSEKSHREILDATSEAIFVIEHTTGVIVESNRAATELFGYSNQELNGMAIGQLSMGQAPFSEPEVMAWAVKAIAEGLQVFEWRSRRRNGEIFWTEVELRSVEIGGVDRLLAVIRDYTRQKQGEEELLESEARFFCLAQASFEGIAIIVDGVIIAANDKHTSMHGYEAEEVIGMNIVELVAPEFSEFFADKVKSGTEEPYEVEALKKDGSRFPIEVRCKALPYRGSFAQVAATRDLSPRRLLQEQFRQAQKMEAFGQLAGGVAHDFNNLLTVILSHAALLQLRGTSVDTEEQIQSVQQIAEAAERAANLTRQLLTFSRRQVIQRTRVDLNEVVRNMTKMLQRILGEQIILQANCSPGWASVYADAGMLEQVLMNLAVNSRDAMPNGGYLIVQTDVVSVTPEDLAKHPNSPQGNYIRMCVTDTGMGIEPKNLARIFEPFFTTKEVGKGTGLGLATVFSIVDQHQGWLEVQSRVGEGTTFQIFLPQGKGVASLKTEKVKAQDIHGGGESILLVEDEEEVRELMKMVLSAKGYAVLEASNAYAAIDVWNQYGGNIDLLFTDLIMPGDIGGKRLADRLRREKPSLKVIYCSGYTDETLGDDFALRTEPNFLPKPFSVTELAEAARRAVGTK